MSIDPSERKHPNPAGVRSLIEELLAESRKACGWKVDVLEFDFYKQSYGLRLALEGNSVDVQVPAESITDCWMDGGRHPRRRIKRLLKDAVKPFAQLDEE